jgi:hypothetical protein
MNPSIPYAVRTPKLLAEATAPHFATRHLHSNPRTKLDFQPFFFEHANIELATDEIFRQRHDAQEKKYRCSSFLQIQAESKILCKRYSTRSQFVAFHIHKIWPTLLTLRMQQLKVATKEVLLLLSKNLYMILCLAVQRDPR